MGVVVICNPKTLYILTNNVVAYQESENLGQPSGNRHSKISAATKEKSGTM